VALRCCNLSSILLQYIVAMNTCPECGTELPAGSRRLGVCPKCLLELGVDKTEGPSTLTLSSQEVQAGQWFGPYQVIRLLGEGGMGIVFLAEQKEPIRRRVALKVIKLGMDTRELIARFESERQALALMDHPNIAKVFDAGVSQGGRPYFVMEYVAGVPITRYCDAHQLTNRQRLELFRSVCMAIHHAHQKGIIHRDIKPSNILVAVVDDQPIPKIIDFGVAKATNQRLTEKTVFTQMGIFIGTPEYMSPEQAELTSLEVDATSDIYSLGVVLYELLVGALPFDSASLRKAGYDEIRRILREEEPPKPTTRLQGLGATATEIAKRRHTDPDSLKKQLRGELDWITMKAMAKEQARRYASASEFSADIGRYLKDEPVLAGPPGQPYRIGKFIRKHRHYVAATLALLICLILGLTVSAAMFFRAESARRDAERQSYIGNLVAADLHLRSNEIAEARRRLFSCPKYLRGWEWRHLFLKSDFSAATLYTLGDSDYENPQVSFAFSPDGTKIYSSTQHTLYSWDAATFLPTGRWSGFGSILAVAPRAERILSKTYTTGGTETDHALRVFDPFSRRLIATLPGHQYDVTAAAFSPDGARLFTGDRWGVVFLWDATSGRTLFRQTGNTGPVIAVAFSGGAERIAAAFWDKTVRIWDAAGRAVATLVHDRDVMAIALSPDGRRLASASADNSMRLWDPTSGRLQLTLNDFDSPIHSLAFSSDGTRILAGTDKGLVVVREADSGKLISSLVGHDSAVWAIAFHPGGQILTADHTKIRIWDPSSSGGVRTLHEHGGRIALSPNGRLLASASADSIRLWDASSGKLLSTLEPLEPSHPGMMIHPGMMTGVLAFGPEGNYLASGSAIGTISIWDLTLGTRVKLMKIGFRQTVQDIGVSHSVGITSIAFSPDGSRLASGSNDGIVRFWDVATGRLLSNVLASDSVNALAFSPDGRRMATGSGDASLVQPLHAPAVRVWDAGSGKLLVTTKPRPDQSGADKGATGDFGWAAAVVYSRDGTRIASSQSGSAGPVIWDAKSGRPLMLLKAPILPFPMARSLAFHADGSRLFASIGSQVQVWDAASGEPLLLLRGHDEPIWSVALSADGSRLVSGANDEIRIWNTWSAYSLEAESLVQSLFDKLHFADDVAELLRTDLSLDEPLRRAALLLVQEEGERGPDAHIREAWKAANAPGAGRGACELALRHARIACELAPWNWEAFNTRGAVQYRLGAYRDAVSSLLHAAELRVRPSITNLAFEALVFNRLGERVKAQSALDEAERLFWRLDTMMDPDLLALVLEAKSGLTSTRR
jgi:WD40 repeat protein